MDKSYCRPGSEDMVLALERYELCCRFWNQIELKTFRLLESKEWLVLFRDGLDILIKRIRQCVQKDVVVHWMHFKYTVTSTKHSLGIII